MKFNNILTFAIFVVILIFVIACNQTTSPQPPKTTFQPVAWLSGQPGAVNLTPTTGNGPFQCAITSGALPAGFVLNNCVISGTAPVLAGGTTKSVSPPFTITITNAAGRQQTLEYNILTVASLPEIIFNEPGTCIVNKKCDINLISQVTGGTPLYHFQSDTFANGAPPIGMIVDLNGVLTGTPTKKGTYNFGVCVVDVVGASKCDSTQVFVEDKSEEKESSGSCSSNSDCTGFATNNCDAPGNVRCGKDGLCHCCLTLCPGGANCRCIDCSTGCGGGTYCEGDVCVFEVGGNIDGGITQQQKAPETSTITPVASTASGGGGLCPGTPAPLSGFWCPQHENDCLKNYVFGGWDKQGSCTVTFATCYYSNPNPDGKVIPINFEESSDGRSWICKGTPQNPDKQDENFCDSALKAMKVECGACTGAYGDIC